MIKYPLQPVTGREGTTGMERMGQVIRLKPGAVAEYRRVHAAVWPEILELISACNITNYSIFLSEGENLLFAYWEYAGSDFAADQARMRADPRMQDWWRITDTMQAPIATAAAGEWWARMQPVFHHG
jgi:L-rhamnose mutarotase